HGDDGIAGVDGTLEGVRALDAHQVGDLRHVEQGGHAGHQILAEGRAGTEDVAVAFGELCDLRRQHLGDGVGVGVIRDGEHAGHAGDLRGFGGHRGRVGRKHHDVDGFRRKRLRGGHALGGGTVELAVVVFGDDQYLGHQSNPLSLSAATSSAASFTITPLLRFAGAAWCVVLSPWPSSTPSSAQAIDSIGLDLAFMMSGSLMKRGSLRRRSVVMTAGRSTSSVSRPASTSRVTVALPSATSSFEAKVGCGRPQSVASIWPVWLASSSIACLPRITRSGDSFSISFSSARAAANG